MRRWIVGIFAAFLWLALDAQAAFAADHGKLRVGAVSLRPLGDANITVAFLERLAELGYVEGETLEFKFVQAADRKAYEAEYRNIVTSGVDILAAGGPQAALEGAIAAADGKIPVVMIATDYDPFARGYVESLAEPGGNVTGVFFRQVALTEKRLELMREAFPDLEGVTVFWDRNSADQWERAQSAGAEMGLPLHGIEFRQRPYDFDAAIAQVPTTYRGALLVLASPLFSLPSRETLADFALRHRLASMFHVSFYPAAGGLMSYGVSFTRLFRRAADYVDKIAKGADPAVLPIEQPTQFELVVNLKTAEALGIEIPESVLLRADKIIE